MVKSDELIDVFLAAHGESERERRERERERERELVVGWLVAYECILQQYSKGSLCWSALQEGHWIYIMIRTNLNNLTGRTIPLVLLRQMSFV